MVDQFHEYKFSVRPFCMRHVLERSTELFDGNILATHCVVGSTEKRNIQILQWRNVNQGSKSHTDSAYHLTKISAFWRLATERIPDRFRNPEWKLQFLFWHMKEGSVSTTEARSLSTRGGRPREQAPEVQDSKCQKAQTVVGGQSPLTPSSFHWLSIFKPESADRSTWRMWMKLLDRWSQHADKRRGWDRELLFGTEEVPLWLSAQKAGQSSHKQKLSFKIGQQQRRTQEKRNYNVKTESQVSSAVDVRREIIHNFTLNTYA